MPRFSRFVIALLLAMAPFIGARAGVAEDVRRTYEAFAAAQNRHDLSGVKDLLLDSPRFLWVSDGKSFWGRDQLVERMALFQQSEVWEVRPRLEEAVAVEIDEHSGYLHLPLVLVVGSREPPPSTLPFLVSVLCVRTDAGWRIAALFTTTEKPEP